MMMRLSFSDKSNTLLAKLLFLIVPTVALCYFLIWNANQYFSILDNNALQQTFYLAAGMIGATIFFSFRFRFLPPTIILFVALYSIYKGIDAVALGEFDTFFRSIQFLFIAIPIGLGWILGWGLSRLKYFSIFIAALFLSVCLLILSKQNNLFYSVNKEAGVIDYALLLGPVVLYSFYIIFMSIFIKNHENNGFRIWWIALKRLTLFLLLFVLIFGSIVYLQSNQIQTTLDEFGGGGQEGKNSMLKKNKDGTFDLNDYTKLSGNLGRSNQLLFAAHIDNFFEGTDIPNPLYLTAFYYSKFDTATETFERDSLLPQSDLFEPDPATIPLFSILSDSSVLKEALTEKYRSTVEIEVYKKELSRSSFVAPSTSFFVQPITVEKDFQDEFSSAYRAKSYVSALNSAYFVYNAPDPAIKAFQESRFEILRSVKNYHNIDPEIKKYYTNMPQGERFDHIKQLADSITQSKNTPVDKVIAIRDYFLSKDENGKPLFSYTDNPGVPDIPSASKLYYFLFENRKGYCAYYAGATLFMLRSLGIPSRITVGFLTVDRSNQNKGWYWFYADQAHAWVQVYFPGYGWLDFDTTVGNDDARESPQPDGTPPMQPPKAYFAGDGIIQRIDTVEKTATLMMHRMMYHDKERYVAPVLEIELDLKVAKIMKDSLTLSLKDIEVGDSATAVSYAEAFKKLPPLPTEKTDQLIKRFPKLAPIDEVYVKKHIKKEKDSTKPKDSEPQQTSWKNLFFGLLAAIGFLLILFAFLPRILFAYFQMRRRMAKSIGNQSYWAFTAVDFYLHQMGFQKGSNTALQFAEQIDAQMKTSFSEFMKVYLKLKYAQKELNQEEKTILIRFYHQSMPIIKKHLPFKHRFKSMFKVLRAINYF